MDRTFHRQTRDGQQIAVQSMARVYPHPPAAVWPAFADPARLSHWFTPVTGDLAVGGRFQFRGNASGTVTECQPERRIAATWEMMGAVSWVTLDFAPDGAGTRVTLTHSARIADFPPGFWEKFGPGATGVGWELGFVGLGLQLDAPGAAKIDENAWVATPAGRAVVIASAEGWAAAAIAGGEDPGVMAATVAELIAFYTGAAP